jgi:diguanylate cyclase (GGDEF)-like protein
MAEALSVRRASVWLLSADADRLICRDLFDTELGTHDDSTALDVAHYPAYFHALDSDRALAAHDARSDPRTVELRDRYLIPIGITSMLDATVRRAGVVSGVVCAEHVGGVRTWTPLEESFAASVADFVSIALEMEERRKAEDALRQSEERYRGFISLSAEGIWRLDLDEPFSIDLPIEEQVRLVARTGRYAECNVAYARMHGFDSTAAILGKTLHDLVPESIYWPFLAQTMRNGYTTNELELARPTRDSHANRWFSLNILGVVRDGMVIRFWGVQREITEKIEHLTALEYQATHDGLTTLWNRDWLRRRLGDAVDTRGEQLALLMIDIDDLREINDSIGHEAGDILLCSVSRRLSALADKHGFDVARFGGDEFAVVAAGGREPAAYASLATMILDTLREPFEVGGISVELGASIGIALAPGHAADAQTLLSRAEVAMYVAMSDLRKYAFYDAERDPHSAARLALVAGLGAAMRRNELRVHFQPKIDLRRRRLAGFEALVRWQHPQRGLVPPGEFMPWAEKSDLIRPLTFWILERSLEQQQIWKSNGIDTTLAVNLSPRNLLDDEAPARIAALVRSMSIKPSSLTLEITEGSMMHDPARALATLREIGALGVGLSIDDFGTGYSSLAYLKRLPIDELKIDLTFVTHMLNNPEDRTIVQSTIGLGHNLGISVTAEGVEDPGTLVALQDMGCDFAQGYYFSTPMAAEAVPGWVAESRFAGM